MRRGLLWGKGTKQEKDSAASLSPGSLSWCHRHSGMEGGRAGGAGGTSEGVGEGAPFWQTPPQRARSPVAVMSGGRGDRTGAWGWRAGGRTGFRRAGRAAAAAVACQGQVCARYADDPLPRGGPPWGGRGAGAAARGTAAAAAVAHPGWLPLWLAP